MASDGYIAIHRTTDVAQGELLAEMLRREGIDARFHKVSASLIGMPGSMFEMSVEVPVAAEERARQLIADLEYTGAAESLERGEPVGGEPERVVAEGAGRESREDQDENENEDEDGDEDGDRKNADAARGAARGPGLSNRRPIFAAGFAVFVPGAGHLYARRAWTALVLGAGAVGCLAIAVTAREVAAIETAGAILLAIMACDAIGGVRAARAEARGQHPRRGRQIVRGLWLLGAAIALGGGARIATAAPRIWQNWQAAKYWVTCSDRAIRVENRGGAAREIEIAGLEVVADSPFGAQTYDVGIGGPRVLKLAPGAAGVVVPDVAEWLARACKFPSVPARPKVEQLFAAPPEGLGMVGPQPTSCGFVFVFSAREEGATDGSGFQAFGTCTVPQAETSSDAATLEPRR